MKHVLHSWGIEDGVMNQISQSVYVVEEGGGQRYILKRMSGDIEKINAELELLFNLSSHEVKVQKPIMNKEGTWSVSDQHQVYVLFNYVEGSPLPANDIHTIIAHGKEVGAQLAILHRELKDIQQTPFYPTIYLNKKICEWAIPQLGSHLKLRADTHHIFANVEQGLKAVCPKLPAQLIHRDAHITNLIFNNHKLTGFIDFEIVEHNIRLFDICYFLTSVLSEVYKDEQKREKWLELVKVVVAGYEEVEMLTEEERQSIWLVMCSIEIIFISFFKNIEIMARLNEEMLHWIYNKRDEISDVVTKQEH
ncbi:phosphotransferase enzyme family protein [Metabacillus iocasae]|uniref:Ser/Thr protein kinase RdoA (MazF antagonist) n=1 Tax=Priestia iocasae TaxID=2291674 RepID=A0ABS2QUG7_9BACI|nr:phosphotransferase [Metabacillus iocasae]MBM7702154.1 Ser/Thr protein kinase RdoA (MazF antagonist) [Metabacillus iocasae]